MMQLFAAVLLGSAVWWLCSPSARLRVVVSTALPQAEREQASLLLRLRIPLSALAFVAGWAFLGGLPGMAVGALAAGVSWRVLGRAESPTRRRRRERLEADLPWGVQLLGSCLIAGAAVPSSLRTVADAIPGPLGDEFGLLHHRLALGEDPVQVWRELCDHDQLRPLGRALVRAQESGTPVAGSIQALADELRARRRAAVEERARSVDVKASAPLGVCFLPAFILLGVVPMVVGIFSSLRLFG
ncbi:type II secretion system F family protein [Nocardioides terrisoli]|uniref:type II secretion system F family protein n=1 Tax=Nocardioides terrisoli TaxID=3388267 RepID=UPI00287B605A|nr:type II secretion system F family protein [Nocardioides marmorisolisilvae]